MQYRLRYTRAMIPKRATITATRTIETLVVAALPSETREEFFGRSTLTVVRSHPSCLGTQKRSSSPDFTIISSKFMNSLKQCPSHVIMRKKIIGLRDTGMTRHVKLIDHFVTCIQLSTFHHLKLRIEWAVVPSYYLCCSHTYPAS